MKLIAAFFGALVLSGPAVAADAFEPTKFVNVFVGTDFNGHTYPGATWPMGMVQPSPDSGWTTWGHCSGYRLKDAALYGFSQTHLSGTGIGDLMDVLLQPYSGEDGDVHHRGLKADETGEPGYYAVTYTNFGVRAELTASRRVAYHRYAFSRGDARVLVDLASGMDGTWYRPAGSWPSNRVVEAQCNFEGDRKLVGWNVVSSWLKGRRVNYVVEFSRPIAWKRRAPATQDGQIAPRWELGFALDKGESLEARIAISPADVAGARRNLAAEPTAFDFDARRKECQEAWRTLLSKAVIEGDEEQKRIYYTALYHAYVQPNLFSDVGTPDELTTFSNWDTYRAACPLYTILTPDSSRVIANSMIEHGFRNGRLSVWELWGRDNRCMIGDHAVPVVVDAILKGIGGIDEARAFEIIDRTLRSRYPETGHDRLGYCPCDRGPEASSKTIESCFDDWCAHLLAKRLGKSESAAFYLKRSRNWRNLWDPETRMLRPRDSNGRWLTPFNPFERQGPTGLRQYTEGSAIHYLWHVQHDPDGLMELMGRQEFGDRLEEMFALPEEMPGQGAVGDCTGEIGQYVHGNEPCQHDIYLLFYAGRTKRAAELVREVCTRFYTNTPDGLAGNDDCGQTSAWYLFSAMGFYPMNPCGGEYVLGAPQVPMVQVKVGGEGERRTFKVLAKGLSKENKYVKSVTLNGKPVAGRTIRHEEIMRGGCLEFEMTDAPGTAIGDPASYVDPFVGTTATGHTFPGACVPFGLVQASPDTGTESWHYCSGYRYEDKSIRGFSHSHLNGTGGLELGDLLILPFSGDAKEPFAESIDKSSENASPGYYAVRLSDSDIRAEVSASEHAAIYRLTYGGKGKARLLVDAQWGVVMKGALKKYVREGEMKVRSRTCVAGRRRTSSWNEREIGFAVLFDRPYSSVTELPARDGEEKIRRLVFDFDLKPGETLSVKVGLAAGFGTDGRWNDLAERAERNLAAEIPGWDFDAVRTRARAAWNDRLGSATIEGSEDEKKNWYTSLYHLFVQPNNLADVGERPFYSTLSCWDTFRAAGPLYTLLCPDKAAAFVDSMLRQGRMTGYLPIWTLWGRDNQCMIGTHSIPMIADAYLKGLDGLPDLDGAYAQIKETLTKRHDGRVKEDWDLYDAYGYYPFDKINGESVSRTLECCYDDWCAAQLAKALGKDADAAFFMKRADYWKNVLDKRSGFVRGRDSRGNWREPFDPFAFGHGAGTNNDFTEGNAFQYTWHVLHDPDGLVAEMGGREATVKRLQALFNANEITGGAPPDVTGLIGQYVHGNEPSHHVIYLFTLLGEPHLTADYVREVFDRFYRPKPDGLCGNDDCGQMSAWYLFSAMGLYPFNPCGGEYVLGAPQVPMAQVKVGGEGERRTFKVLAKGLSKENKYVKSVTLNGKPVAGRTIRHADIVAGGTLVFEMESGKR